jgi:hypothetical protein
MTDPNILFKNLAKNIHYTTGTGEEDYPDLDKEFYELLAQIKQMTVPLNVKTKPNQLQQISWGLSCIAGNNSRTYIVNDFLSILNKFKIPQMSLENYLSLILYTSMVSKDKTMEENVLKLIPETICSIENNNEVTHEESLGFMLFLYYFLKGDQEKAKSYLKDILIYIKSEITLEYVKVSDNDKKEIEKIIKEVESTIKKQGGSHG